MSTKVELLSLPPEILLRIIEYLFVNQHVRVEPSQALEASSAFRMKRTSMSGQFIHTCRKIYEETHCLLYSTNVFNCVYREGLKLLLQSTGSKNCSLIKHVIIDWDQLEDFAWSLAKENYRTAFSGLETIELATGHKSVLGASSFWFREGKSYERQLRQAALNICEKHANLNLVAQRPFRRIGRGADPSRVMWRFIQSEADMKPDESIVQLAEDLAQLKASGDSDTTGSEKPMMIDAF